MTRALQGLTRDQLIAEATVRADLVTVRAVELAEARDGLARVLAAARQAKPRPATLGELAEATGLSAERIRQIVEAEAKP